MFKLAEFFYKFAENREFFKGRFLPSKLGIETPAPGWRDMWTAPYRATTSSKLYHVVVSHFDLEMYCWVPQGPPWRMPFQIVEWVIHKKYLMEGRDKKVEIR